MAIVLAPLAAAMAADPADPAWNRRDQDWVAQDFRFHTGEVMAALHRHYVTLGQPSGQPVLILHGTTGTGAGLLTPDFGGQLFGPGQALDARRYFIILPDAIGTGGSAKPSDGLRARFPRYDYDDMIQADYRLLTEALGLHHLRLILGNSMGGMETWQWGVTHPDFMDALVPMAAQPTAMAGRNWMMRRALVEAIRQDPAYHDGNYTTPPPVLRLANVLFVLGTNGGTQGLQALGATHALADHHVDALLAAPPPQDANDFIYQWDAARDYDPSSALERITAKVLAINSADDERNPPETGLMDQALKRIKTASLDLIPASADTHGHGTTGYARFWAARLQAFLRE
jgi:homoserine O-acetyltransferase